MCSYPKNLQISPLNHLDELFLGLQRQRKEFFVAISKQITDNLDMYRRYGFLVEKIDRQIRSERVFNAELIQQYDGIEITPPLSAVLDAQIEKVIAERNDLFQVRGPQPEE